MSRAEAASAVLRDRVALITGGGQGLGRAFVRALASAGAAVVVADINAATANEVAGEIAEDGGHALGLAVDITDETAVNDAVAEIKATFGRLDVLINNAAVMSTLTMQPFEDIPTDEWRTVIDVNLTGMFITCRAVSGLMREQRRGAIINISSGTALNGRPHYLHYVSSKAGAIGLTRGLARELGSSGVTVNAILPGSVDTGIERASAPSGNASTILAPQALKWRLQPTDITGTAVFLASDAARSITGQSLVVDAGANFV